MARLNKALHQLSEFIGKIHDDLVHSGPGQAVSPQSGISEVMFWKQDYGGLALNSDDAKQYRQCISSLAKAAGDRVSPETVEGLAQKAILDAIDVYRRHVTETLEDRLPAIIQEARLALTAPQPTWRVNFGVEGMTAAGLPFKVGDVLFQVANDTLVGDWCDLVDKAIDSWSDESEDKTWAKQSAREDLQVLADRVVGTVDVNAADASAATYLAKSVLRETVDAVNFYSDLLLSDGLRARVYLPEEGQRGPDIVTALVPEQNGGLHIAGSRAREAGRISPEVFQSARAVELGFPKMSNLLARRKGVGDGELARDLLAAIRWAGRATVDDRRDEAFLLYMIALETLMQPQREGEYSYRLSRRAAHLLIRSSPERRRDVARDVNELYRSRSAIVHGGHTDITLADLSRVRFITKEIILRILIQEPFISMRSREELEQWFEDQMLR